jgi:hypothetical protein
MHFLSYAWKDHGIAIDADLRPLSGFILERFPSRNKAIAVPLAQVHEMPGEMRILKIIERTTAPQ